MHCHSGDFIKSCMWSDCCGYCQNKQDGGWWVFSLRRKTRWVFVNFLEKWLHYKVNKYPMTKNKPIYRTRNINRWKGSVKPRPFIGLLILNVINLFIFGHGVLIYYIKPQGKRRQPLGTVFLVEAERFDHWLHVSKNSTALWFYAHFVMILYMYIALGQGQTAH